MLSCCEQWKLSHLRGTSCTPERDLLQTLLCKNAAI